MLIIKKIIIIMKRGPSGKTKKKKYIYLCIFIRAGFESFLPGTVVVTGDGKNPDFWI